MNLSRSLVLIFLTLALIGVSPAPGVDVPRWQTYDLSFKSTTPHANQFKVDFYANVTGPGGIQFTQLGFYDGEGTWRVRLGPNVPGKWAIRTVSNDPQLNGK